MERPHRREIAAAAVSLIARHGAKVLAAARRYAATPEDAEDAYQRGLEILLTKAPTTSDAELLPWLKTVVIHTIDPPRRDGLAAPNAPVDLFLKVPLRLAAHSAALRGGRSVKLPGGSLIDLSLAPS